MNNRQSEFLRTRVAGIGLLILIFVLLFILLPFIKRYYVEVIMRVAILFIVVVSYRSIVSMGRWSFFHAQLFGMGGYVSAILEMKFGYPFWVTFFVGGLASAFIALVLSYPLLRTKGFYFFMSTFVVGSAMIWVWKRFVDPFGGIRGLSGIERPGAVSCFGITLDFGNWLTWAYVVLFVVLICLLVLNRLEKIRLASILKSIGSSRDLVSSVGINPLRYEIIGFVIACFFAGLAGGLFVHNNMTCSPSDYSSTLGMNIIVYTVVGGLNSYWGAILGVTVLAIINELLRSYAELMPLIYGIIMVAVVLLLPDGLISVPQRIRNGWGPFLTRSENIPVLRDMIKRRRN